LVQWIEDIKIVLQITFCIKGHLVPDSSLDDLWKVTNDIISSDLVDYLLDNRKWSSMILDEMISSLNEVYDSRLRDLESDGNREIEKNTQYSSFQRTRQLAF
jgi:hypothetical protein